MPSDHTDDVTFSELLAQHLELPGSAAAFADQLAVSQPQVSRWRKGQDTPGDHRIPELAAAMGLSEDLIARSLRNARVAKGPPKGPTQLNKLRQEVEELRALVRKLGGTPPGDAQ